MAGRPAGFQKEEDEVRGKRAKYEKENQRERKQREKDKSILWYSENRVYILFLMALWVASFMVNVPQS